VLRYVAKLNTHVWTEKIQPQVSEKKNEEVFCFLW
jgi:hypothetical protein